MLGQLKNIARATMLLLGVFLLAPGCKKMITARHKKLLATN